MDDVQLLWEFARTGSSEIFGRIARRYIDLVYSAAVRQVRDRHVAEDVTQAVFIILMQKAGQLRENTVVPAWLLKVTRFAAMDAMKLAQRRRQHEWTGGMMRLSQTDREAKWDDVAPVLDEALMKLSPSDRDAVVMRYLLNKSPEEIAWDLQVTEDAARQRVSRGLARLRKILGRKGAVASETALGVMLATKAIEAAPADVSAMAETIATAASSAVSAPAAMIAHAALRGMLWATVKSVATIGVCAAIFIAAAGLGAVMLRDRLAAPRAIATARPRVSPSAASPGQTPLISAASRNDAAKMKELIAAGVDVNAISSDGNNTSALMYAVARPRDAALETTKLLIDAGADVNIRHGQWGYTALMRAARMRSPKTVALLLERGADPTVKDSQGRTAIDFATEGDDAEVIRILRAAMAAPK